MAAKPTDEVFLYAYFLYAQEMGEKITPLRQKSVAKAFCVLGLDFMMGFYIRLCWRNSLFYCPSKLYVFEL